MGARCDECAPGYGGEGCTKLPFEEQELELAAKAQQKLATPAVSPEAAPSQSAPETVHEQIAIARLVAVQAAAAEVAALQAAALDVSGSAAAWSTAAAPEVAAVQTTANTAAHVAETSDESTSAVTDALAIGCAGPTNVTNTPTSEVATIDAVSDPASAAGSAAREQMDVDKVAGHSRQANNESEAVQVVEAAVEAAGTTKEHRKGEKAPQPPRGVDPLAEAEARRASRKYQGCQDRLPNCATMGHFCWDGKHIERFRKIDCCKTCTHEAKHGKLPRSSRRSAIAAEFYRLRQEL
jgi:hypothetical protein